MTTVVRKEPAAEQLALLIQRQRPHPSTAQGYFFGNKMLTLALRVETNSLTPLLSYL